MLDVISTAGRLLEVRRTAFWLERNGGPEPIDQTLEALANDNIDPNAKFEIAAAYAEVAARRPTTEPRPQGCGPEAQKPRELSPAGRAGHNPISRASSEFPPRPASRLPGRRGPATRGTAQQRPPPRPHPRSR